MKIPFQAARGGILLLTLASCVAARAAESSPPSQITDIRLITRLTIESQVGWTNVIEYSYDLNDSNGWSQLTTQVVKSQVYTFDDLGAQRGAQRFYRVLAGPQGTNPPPVTVSGGMVLIPAGTFTMGDADAMAGNGPDHPVSVSAFLMDSNEVAYTLWTNVYRWATAAGYSFGHAGAYKAANHPVQNVDWYDVVKWCNARSEKEGLRPCYYTDAEYSNVYRQGTNDLSNSRVDWNANGYRLPTEAEWERAARGGKEGLRFPWDGDTISQQKANYYSITTLPYDEGPGGHNKTYSTGAKPYTCPVTAFAANGYGLRNMVGNVAEWCWDYYDRYYYQSTANAQDPRGPTSGSNRLTRGGSWDSVSTTCTCFSRNSLSPKTARDTIGFRCVRLPVLE